jgi:rRNA-processing protein FCF1
MSIFFFRNYLIFFCFSMILDKIKEKMKIKRHKHTKNVLKFYKINFNIDTKHFHVLIDGTFANEALNSKINLAEQLPNYFDVQANKCKLLTTKCAIHETEILGKPTYGAMLILKQYELVECNHKRNFVSSEKCFKKLLEDSVQNQTSAKYFMASQVNQFKTFIIKILLIFEN